MTSSVFLKINDFETLEAGWCYGEGMPFCKQSLAAARQVALSLLQHGFGQLDAFPGIHGEIRVTAYDGDVYIEFTIDPDQAATFVRERNGQELDYREGLSIPDCLSLMPIREPCLWNLFESSIPGISIHSWDVFRAWHSGRQATAEYPSFVERAPQRSADRFAATSGCFTPASAANRPSSGLSTEPYFRPVMDSKNRRAIPMIHVTGTS